MREGLDGDGFEGVVGGDILKGRRGREGAFGLFVESKRSASAVVIREIEGECRNERWSGEESCRGGGGAPG